MALLTRDQILSASDLPFEDIPVPEWGGDVRVRTLTGTERDEFEQSCIKKKGKDSQVNLANIRAKLVSSAACDEEGKALFSEADVVALGKKSGKALDRVFAAAQRLSGLSKEDVEELAKN